MKRRQFLQSTAAGGLVAGLAMRAQGEPAPRVDGYRGIWFTLGQFKEFGDKYSGGLGTYTANHVPMAVHSAEVEKTFFVYGGTLAGQRHLLCMASYYDHRRHRVPRPVVVHDKQGVDDPHDNPSLCIDGQGHLWVFVSGRGRHRPGLIYRSREPHSVDAFEPVMEREMTYPQPRWVEGQGFVLLFTKYTKGRELYTSTSLDGRIWTPDQKFVGTGGHYQSSHQVSERIVTAFNHHPGGNVDLRTNLYFLQTTNGAKTWQNASGQIVPAPLTTTDNAALVHDYQAEHRLVYIHDLDLDSQGHPVILYITSADHAPGPPGDPRYWTLARWTGTQWVISEIGPANHNYSTGSLYLDGDAWRVVGPLQRGPQPIGSGGEIAKWESVDHGRTWFERRRLTDNSPRNHNYVRRPFLAHSDFSAFWADGNPDAFSESHLYFASADGNRVWRLPYDMPGDFAEPEPLAP